MKNFFKILLIIILLVILAYSSNITQIPKNIILFQGEDLNIMTMLGLTLHPKKSYEAMQTSMTIGEGVSNSSNEIGKIELNLSLFNTFNVKDVTVDVIRKTKVIPVGDTIGLKLYTKGVLVVGVSEVTDEKNEKNEPYILSGIKEGDTILTINEEEVSSTEELVKKVNESKGNDVKITYDSNGEIKVANIKPSKNTEGTYKLGLWVRDAAAGVGTISYYEPETKIFAALGHGIQDVDTGKLISIANGEIVTASIIDVVKGEKGKPRRDQGKYFKWKRGRYNHKKHSFWDLRTIKRNSNIRY